MLRRAAKLLIVEGVRHFAFDLGFQLVNTFEIFLERLRIEEIDERSMRTNLEDDVLLGDKLLRDVGIGLFKRVIGIGNVDAVKVFDIVRLDNGGIVKSHFSLFNILVFVKLCCF